MRATKRPQIEQRLQGKLALLARFERAATIAAGRLLLEEADSPNGEIQTKDDNAGTTSYGYDALGNLLSVALPTGSKIEYVIDAAGRRIGKKLDGTLTKGFLYRSALQPVAELDAEGNIVSVFVYASRSNVPDYQIRGTTMYRMISDLRGSPRLVVDVATGAIEQRLEYDAWGNVTADTNPGFQPFGFAGGLYDADTGLVRFGSRDYDASIGRWVCRLPKTASERCMMSDPPTIVFSAWRQHWGPWVKETPRSF